MFNLLVNKSKYMYRVENMKKRIPPQGWNQKKFSKTDFSDVPNYHWDVCGLFY